MKTEGQTLLSETRGAFRKKKNLVCFGLYRPSSGAIYTVVFRSYYAKKNRKLEMIIK
jgi:hypothetical protein